MALLGVLALVIVAVALWQLWSSRRHRHTVTSTPAANLGGAISGARALLDERLARGEIEPDDYERRRALLTQ